MMDSNLQSSPPDSIDTKNAFRKPSGDAANRNYRRRSPIDGSPSSDGSPKRENSLSPNPSRENYTRMTEHHSRKEDDREQDRYHGRSHHGRSGDSFRHSDRHSSKSYHGHSKHEDSPTHDKFVDEDRYRERISSRSEHTSRGVDKYYRDKYDRSDYAYKGKDREASFLEHKKYKDKGSLYDRAGSGTGRRHAPSSEVERERHTRDRDGRDERRDSHRGSGDYKSDRRVFYSESRSQKDDSSSHRDSDKYHLKEAYKSKQKVLDGQKSPGEERKKYNDSEISRDRDRNARKGAKEFNDGDKDSSAKKLKLIDVDKDDVYGKEEYERKTSKFTEESKVDLGTGTAQATGSEGAGDINAAKVAAMKAAELVNRNLVGVGCLTTDQKKKLLWGNKKSTTAEESGHRWDTSLFSDRERQEKFNKLMGVKGDPRVEQNADNAEKQKELQQDLEKQYTAGLRRRDGRTVGLGL